MKITSILTTLLLLLLFSCDEDTLDKGADGVEEVSHENDIDYSVCTNCIWLKNNCNGNWLVAYNIDSAISGFQLNIDGAIINNVYGGDSETAQFSVSSGNQTILGFSLLGGYMPPGSGTLCILDLDGTPTSINNIIFPDLNAQPLNISNHGIVNCYSSLLENTGESQLTIFNNTITSLEVGDEIGVFDLDGIINYNDCSNERGELLVGSGFWIGEQLNIVSTGSVDLCHINGMQLSGYIENNPLIIKVYRHETGKQYDTEISWETGTGVFGEVIQSINNINLILTNSSRSPF